MTTYDSESFIDNSKEAALYSGWETLKEYLSSMEDYLKKATEQFEARVSEQEKTLTSEQFHEFEIDHVEESIFYRDEFPKIVRNSFFVSAYSLFESNLGRICGKLKSEKKVPIGWKDLQGSTLNQFKLYTKLAGLDLPCDDKTWQEIKKYSEVRNSIVHDNGLLKEDKKELAQYAKGKGLIMERSIIVDEATESEIGLTEHFCKEVVNTMQGFILAAYKASKTREKK